MQQHETPTVLLASRGYYDPVATPHVFDREEPTPAGLAQIYRCTITGAERRYGLHALPAWTTAAAYRPGQYVAVGAQAYVCGGARADA